MTRRLPTREPTLRVIPKGVPRFFGPAAVRRARDEERPACRRQGSAFCPNARIHY